MHILLNHLTFFPVNLRKMENLFFRPWQRKETKNKLNRRKQNREQQRERQTAHTRLLVLLPHAHIQRRHLDHSARWTVALTEPCHSASSVGTTRAPSSTFPFEPASTYFWSSWKIFQYLCRSHVNSHGRKPWRQKSGGKQHSSRGAFGQPLSRMGTAVWHALRVFRCSSIKRRKQSRGRTSVTHKSAAPNVSEIPGLAKRKPLQDSVRLHSRGNRFEAQPDDKFLFLFNPQIGQQLVELDWCLRKTNLKFTLSYRNKISVEALRVENHTFIKSTCTFFNGREGDHTFQRNFHKVSWQLPKKI